MHFGEGLCLSPYSSDNIVNLWLQNLIIVSEKCAKCQ